MDQDLRILVLFALYDLAQENRPAHVGNVAARLGAERAAVARVLVQLERKQLCDAARCRLTMRGLLVATTLRNATSAPARAARVAA